MNANRIDYVAPTAPLLARFLGNDILRSPIKFELEEVRYQLHKSRSMDEAPCVGSISRWRDVFFEAMTQRDPNNYPNLKEVTSLFVDELISILRGPVGPETPFPVELFGDKPDPIVQFMVAKLRDPNSVFYSQPFDEEAIRILAQANIIAKDDQAIPMGLIEQLRQREANKAKELEKETLSMSKIEELRAQVQRVSQRRVALEVNINRVGRENLEKRTRISEETKRLWQEGLEKNRIMIEKANALRNEAEEVKDRIPLLKEELKLTREEMEKLKQANVQLKSDINQLRNDIDDRKSSWVAEVACIVASVVVSWILKKPVIITPNGGSVG
jgi:hypothetical protein